MKYGLMSKQRGFLLNPFRFGSPFTPPPIAGNTFNAYFNGTQTPPAGGTFNSYFI